MSSGDRDRVLDLPVGSLLQVQPTTPQNAPRYSVRLIGYLPNHSLVVTAPTVDGKVQIVREGQPFNARALKGERVFGFVARVLHSSMKPYPHLHLEYPSEFEQIMVRNASRVNADIDVRVRNTQDPDEETNFCAAKIVDLSETGARLSSENALGEPGETLHLKFDLTISGGVEQLGLLGDVRNRIERIEQDETGERLIGFSGVQFRKLSRYQQILLHAWVTYEALHRASGVRG